MIEEAFQALHAELYALHDEISVRNAQGTCVRYEVR